MPAVDILRYAAETPHILSLKAVDPGIDLLLEAGMELVRQKSIHQAEYLIFLVEEWLHEFGFRLGSPRDASVRGSHVSLRHPEAYCITRAQIEAESPDVQVIPDFRETDHIRIGLAPLYIPYREIFRAMEQIRIVAEERLH